MQDALRFVESCIDRYAEQAWRTAYVMLQNASDADDLLQQSFIVAWRKADSAPGDNAWPWLAGVIANEARNFRRKRALRRGVPLDSAGEPMSDSRPESEVERAELAALVHLALSDLSEDQRLAIVLTHLSGLSQSQAAEALGLPLNTVKARVRRGMEKLRDAVGRKAPDLSGTLRKLPVAAPPGGLAAAKAAWTTALATEIGAAAISTTGGVSVIVKLLAISTVAIVVCSGAFVAIDYLGDGSENRIQLAENDLGEPESEPAIDDYPHGDTRDFNAALTSNDGYTRQDSPDEYSTDSATENARAAKESSSQPSETDPQVEFVDDKEGLKLAFEIYRELLPMLSDELDEGTKLRTRDLLAGGSDPWATLGAVEAIRQAEQNDPGSCEEFFSAVLGLLEGLDAKHVAYDLMCVNVLACLQQFPVVTRERRTELVEKVLEWGGNGDEVNGQTEYRAEQLLLHATGIHRPFSKSRVGIRKWEGWLRDYKDWDGPGLPIQDDEPSERQPCFAAEAVSGERVVFVLDTSSSMMMAIPPWRLDAIRKLFPHLDFTDIDTWMDLAKAELAYSLGVIEEEYERRRTDKSLQGARKDLRFSIVAYSTEGEVLTEGWVEARSSNVSKWTRRIRELEPDALTNMHGALEEAFSLAGEDNPVVDPATDLECALNGAQTIYFISDGYATWSNDSTEMTRQNEFGQPIGDGDHVNREKLLELAARLNRFRKVTIHTIGLSGSHDKEFLQNLAKVSNGTYVNSG